jgi:hypothetical protein
MCDYSFLGNLKYGVSGKFEGRIESEKYPG